MTRNEALAALGEFLGKGDSFEVGAHKYHVRPLNVDEVFDFLEDNLPISMPLYLLVETWRAKTDKYLRLAVTDEKGEPVTVEMVRAHKWPLPKLKECFERMVMLSG